MISMQVREQHRVHLLDAIALQACHSRIRFRTGVKYHCGSLAGAQQGRIALPNVTDHKRPIRRRWPDQPTGQTRCQESPAHDHSGRTDSHTRPSST